MNHNGDVSILARRRNGSNVYYQVANPCLPVLLERGVCLIECTQESKTRPRRAEARAGTRGS